MEETDLHRSVHRHPGPLADTGCPVHRPGRRLPGPSSRQRVQEGVSELGCLHHVSLASPCPGDWDSLINGLLYQDHHLLHLLLSPLLSHIQLPLLSLYPGLSSPERHL